MGIVGSSILFTIAFSLPAFVMFVGGSTKIHDLMLHSVMRAPLKFFHTNPTGRIINRFSKDQGMVDDLLPLVVMDVMSILTFTIGSIVLVSIAAPLILPLVFLLGFFFVKLRRKYVRMSREVKRFDGITRSPVYAVFSENLRVWWLRFLCRPHCCGDLPFVKKYTAMIETQISLCGGRIFELFLCCLGIGFN